MGGDENMKTIKSLIVASALLIGFYANASARGCEQENGWSVTTVTGSAATIFEGAGWLKRIDLSTGTQDEMGGQYLIAMATVPSAVTGAGVVSMPNHLFLATTAETPSLMFLTTSTANNGYLNNSWDAGSYGDCVRIPGGSPDGTGRVGGALHIRMSGQASGGARTATVYWSK
jgi:hypothetical protein